MNDFFGSIWWFVVTIGVLVTFHEFGHYWVARRCGVKVLKFSIGFGKSLWSRTGKDGTVYSIGAIPLGGYVSMLDERVEDVPADQRHMAHNNKSNLQKIAIAAAGPGFNFLLAILAFWVMFSIGKPDYQPVLGKTEGLAAEAGLTSGTRIMAVDGKAYSTFSEAFMAVIEKSIYRRDAVLSVREPDGDLRDVTLQLSRLPADLDDKLLSSRIGLQLLLPAVVGRLTSGDPAERAGIQMGDEILAINDRTVADFINFREVLREEASRDPALRLTLARNGKHLELAVTARPNPQKDGTQDFILGFYPQGTNAVLRYDPISALPAALRETWTTTTKTVGFMRDILTGLISPKHLSGPITIARVANSVAKDGLAWFLGFLAAVSVGIAILNLLPIPILDGGHILSYLIESLKGSPLSEKSVMVGQYLGLGVLACLIGLAVFNDFTR
jgi:regulator of sigma E protease